MGEIYVLESGREQSGMRIDAFLSEQIDGISRSGIQKLISSGQILVEGCSAVSKNYRLRESERITVELPEPEVLDVQPENIPLDIVYEDADLLVVNKPRGMVVHPAVGNRTGTLVNAIMYHCGEHLSSINGIIRPGIVHRIDKDTSGLLVVAKTDVAHHGLAEQFAVHSIRRAYLAVVYHNLKEDEGRIDAPIGRNPKDRLKMAVVREESGRRAVTNYQVLQRSGKFTLVECRLETGRTHQIRVHMSHIGHPLLGDPLYGPRKGVGGINGQVLHAGALGFVHPVTGGFISFKAAPPEAFLNAMSKVGLSPEELSKYFI